VRLDAPDKEYEAGLSELPGVLQVAAGAECKRAVANLAPGSDEHSFKDFFELHRSRLHAIGSLLAPHGIMLGLAIRPEHSVRAGLKHPFIHTFEGLLGLVMSAHDRVGAIADAWALHVTGEPVSMIGQVPAGRLVEVRLSDAPRGTPSDALLPTDRLMPGDTGTIAGGAVLKAAATAGFQGPATPWASRTTLAGRGREKIVRLAGERMEQAWRDAGLEILPRWFAPVARDQFGRPIEDLAEGVVVAAAAESADEATAGRGA